MKYEYNRRCECGHTEAIEVTRKEACFNLKGHEIWRKKCPKCGKSNSKSMSAPFVEIEKDLLLEWGNNENYRFLDQDEDLILARESYIDLILDVLDNHQILQNKRNILIGALCVIIFDNVETDDKPNQDLIDRLIKELKKRPDDVKNAESWISDYIAEVVFPMLKES